MVTFVVTPRQNAYWIDRVSESGKRDALERWINETEALARLEVLRKQAELVDRRRDAQFLRGIQPAGV